MSEDCHSSDNTHITVECKFCGYWFDALHTMDCPACTAIRETESRKAYLHQAHIAKCEVCSFHYDTTRSPNCPTCAIQARKAYAQVDDYREKLTAHLEAQRQDEDAPVEMPRGLRMPLGDAAQIYELRRMFRL